MKYIQSNKFSDTVLSIRTVLPLSRDTITALNLLAYMMQTKTEKFDTKQKLVTALNLNYGVKMYLGLSAYGNNLLVNLNVRYIRSDWIDESDYSSKVKNLINEVLYHSIFDEDSFEEAKFLYKTKLSRLMDNPDGLVVYKIFENLDSSLAISIPVQGNLQDLETMSLQDIQDVYTLFSHSPKHVYACGNLDSVMKDYLNSIDTPLEPHKEWELVNLDLRKPQRIQKDISQSSVALLYKTKTSILDKEYYPLIVMNSIFGQCPSSLLFENVREKNSLCYSIHSSLIRFDGALLVCLGVKKENISKALELIHDQLVRIQTLDFDEDLLTIAKKDIIDGMIVGQDQASSLIEQEFLNDYVDRHLSLEEKINRLKSVTLKDIQQVSQKIALVSTMIVEEE